MESDPFGGLSIMFILVPALFAVIALIILGTGVRDLVRGNRLTSQGTPTRGTVVDTFVRSYGHDDSRRPHRVETIEFITSSGQKIRSAPAIADVGMLDRIGQEVDVLYDRHQPETFIAPKNGRRLSPAKPLLKIGICGGALVFMLAFAWMFLGMSRVITG